VDGKAPLTIAPWRARLWWKSGDGVYVDYLLKPVGRSLEDTPEFDLPDGRSRGEGERSIPSSCMNAPMILREAGTFAYNGGLIFEGELLHRAVRRWRLRGIRAAAAEHARSAAARDVHPDEKLRSAHPGHAGSAEQPVYVYDSGGIGELDVARVVEAIWRTEDRG